MDGYIASEPRTELIGLANNSESQVKTLRENQRALKKLGDTDAAKEIDGIVAEVMKGLNTEMRVANR